MRFYLIEEDQYHLKGTDKRYVHICTVGYGVREFMYFLDSWTNSSYLEEVTGGSLSKIEDIELWKGLAAFVRRHKLHMVEGNT